MCMIQLLFESVFVNENNIIVVLLGFQVTVELSDQCAFKNEEFQWLVL